VHHAKRQVERAGLLHRLVARDHAASAVDQHRTPRTVLAQRASQGVTPAVRATIGVVRIGRQIREAEVTTARALRVCHQRHLSGPCDAGVTAPPGDGCGSVDDAMVRNDARRPDPEHSRPSGVSRPPHLHPGGPSIPCRPGCLGSSPSASHLPRAEDKPGVLDARQSSAPPARGRSSSDAIRESASARRPGVATALIGGLRASAQFALRHPETLLGIATRGRVSYRG